MSDRTRAAYDAAFQAERMVEYPVMDALEKRFGYAVDRDRLEDAARVLACPLKKNRPNWQHGRLIYALGRSYLAREGGHQFWLDVGTAKGFSAVCMSWALQDGGRGGDVFSHDIIDPHSREPRNSVEDGKTIVEFIAPFQAKGVFIGVRQGSAVAWSRVNFAFIDGSHTYEGVKSDIETIAPRQQAGDIMLFDDMQAHGVKAAVVGELGRFGLYEIEEIRLLPSRIYAIAVRQ